MTRYNNNETTIYEKKPRGSLYVAYVQESPETENPSVSSLRVSRLLFPKSRTSPLHARQLQHPAPIF